MPRFLVRSLLSACLVLALFVIGHGTAHAGDRALLIGVGDYANPDVGDLQAIDVDLQMMAQVAQILEFEERDIKVLFNAQATQAAAERAIESWLVQGVGADDRALLYFSGHGTQVRDGNGDESDGLDEALVMQDFAVRRVNGQYVASGALVDDRINELISRIPTDKVMVVVDSCHSGTTTRSMPLGTRSMGSLTGVPKFHTYEGMPTATGSGTRSAGVADDPGNVLIAAARDDVQLILNKDPELKGERGNALRVLLYLFERDAGVRFLLAG